jgi:hypothetical protein
MMRIKLEVEVPLGVIEEMLEPNIMDGGNGSYRTGVDVKKRWTQDRSLRNTERKRYRQ